MAAERVLCRNRLLFQCQLITVLWLTELYSSTRKVPFLSHGATGASVASLLKISTKTYIYIYLIDSHHFTSTYPSCSIYRTGRKITFNFSKIICFSITNVNLVVKPQCLPFRGRHQTSVNIVRTSVFAEITVCDVCECGV